MSILALLILLQLQAQRVLKHMAIEKSSQACYGFWQKGINYLADTILNIVLIMCRLQIHICLLQPFENHTFDYWSYQKLRFLGITN